MELYDVLKAGALRGGSGSGGGGFTPTQEQLDAMNSGIDSTKVAQITTNETNILSILNELIENISVNPDDYQQKSWGISSSTGKWSNATRWKSIFIPIDEKTKKIAIKANSLYNAAVALLKSMPTVDGSTPDYATGGNRVSIATGESAELVIANDCQYVWVLCAYNAENHIPESIVETREKQFETTVIPLSLHTMPENQGQLNLIKRCRQLTDVKWTPAVDLPRLMRVQRSYPYPDTESEWYNGVFKAGVEYTGVPYGRANDIRDYDYDYGYVGRFIGLDTFVTAISNPQSIVSKESQYSASDHEATIYGEVCSGLTCYALNVSYHATASIPDISGLNPVGKIIDEGVRIDTSTFKLGDVLNLQGDHTGVITDIIHDSEGKATFIEISEATVAGLADKNYKDGQSGGICRRKGWDIENFFEAWGNYTLFRYSNIANIPYTPSPYVNVGDEMDMYRVVHYPCMPYMGENFKYKSGYIPNTDIVISPDLGYNYLRVFKDDVEITSSPFTVTSETEKISVGFSEIGDYEAYLCTMNNGTDVTVSHKCHWKVVE